MFYMWLMAKIGSIITVPLFSLQYTKIYSTKFVHSIPRTEGLCLYYYCTTPRQNCQVNIDQSFCKMSLTSSMNSDHILFMGRECVRNWTDIYFVTIFCILYKNFNHGQLYIYTLNPTFSFLLYYLRTKL